MKRADISDLVKAIEMGDAEELSRSEDIGWAIARNYSQIRIRLKDQTLIEMAKRIAIRATILRVLQLLGPVSLPTRVIRSEYRVGDDSDIDVEATLEAARLRLRPILMTSLAFGFGVLPLAIAGGAGAGAMKAIGTSVLGGMVTATFLAILFIPLFFVLVVQVFGRKRAAPAGPPQAGETGAQEGR